MTIQEFLNTYSQISSEEAQLLKDAVVYWQSKHPKKNGSGDEKKRV